MIFNQGETHMVRLLWSQCISSYVFQYNSKLPISIFLPRKSEEFKKVLFFVPNSSNTYK